MSGAPSQKRQRLSNDAVEVGVEGQDPHSDTRLPVTVLSGFLGSGKTTTLTHLLNNSDGVRIALIVNDMASLNVDALQVTNEMAKEQLLRVKNEAKNKASSDVEGSAATAAPAVQAPKMVALQNGCICCTLREDLVEQVAELANGNKYDYLIIESTGISEPVPVAQTFCHSLEELAAMAGHSHDHDHDHDHGDDQKEVEKKKEAGTDDNQEDVEMKQSSDAAADAAAAQKKLAVQAIELQKIARLDTMVTVVDSCEVWDVLGCLETIGSSKWSKQETTDEKGEKKEVEGIDLERNIADLLVDQIEFANVILLNKKDLLLKKAREDAEKDKADTTACEQQNVNLLENLIRKLNPDAKIHWTEHGKICPKNVLGTKLFDFAKAQKSAGWLQELANDGNHTPETEEYGISSVVFRSTQPFHPRRLYDILNGFGRISDHVLDNTKTNDASKQVFRGVIRSKGQVWLANCSAYRMDWHSVGRQFSMNPGQPFESAVEDAGYDPSDLFEGAVGTNDDENAKMEVDGKEKATYSAAAAAKLSDAELLKAAFGDRGNELVVIGVQLDKSRITKELENALVSLEECKKAAAEKLKFEHFIGEVKKSGGEAALAKLTEKKVKKGTGGLQSPWDRFIELEDAFFEGKAVEQYMEYAEAEEESDDEEDSKAEEETDVGSCADEEEAATGDEK
eukprot:g15326.t1